MNLRRAIFSLVAFFVTSVPLYVYAQGLVPCQDDCQFCHLASLLRNISDWLIGVLSVFVAIAFVYAGFRLVTSQGNVAAKEAAKKLILNVAIGYTIVLSAWILIDYGMKVLAGGGEFGTWNAIQCVDQPVSRVTASGLNQSEFTEAETRFHASQINASGGSCDSYKSELCNIATTRGLGSYCNVLDAQMYQESTCRPTVSSPANAHGLMQLLPGTAREVCNSLSEYNCSGLSDAQITSRLKSDTTFNMRLGVEYFAQGLQATNGNVRDTLARYNGGPRALLPSSDCPGMKRWECHINPGGYVETQNYVANITGTAEVLTELSESGVQ